MHSCFGYLLSRLLHALHEHGRRLAQAFRLLGLGRGAACPTNLAVFVDKIDVAEQLILDAEGLRHLPSAQLLGPLTSNRFHSPDEQRYDGHRDSGTVRFSDDTKKDSNIDLSGFAWWLIWCQRGRNKTYNDILEARLSLPVLENRLNEALHMLLTDARRLNRHERHLALEQVRRVHRRASQGLATNVGKVERALRSATSLNALTSSRMRTGGATQSFPPFAFFARL